MSSPLEAWSSSLPWKLWSCIVSSDQTFWKGHNCKSFLSLKRLTWWKTDHSLESAPVLTLKQFKAKNNYPKIHILVSYLNSIFFYREGVDNVVKIMLSKAKINKICKCTIAPWGFSHHGCHGQEKQTQCSLEGHHGSQQTEAPACLRVCYQSNFYTFLSLWSSPFKILTLLLMLSEQTWHVQAEFLGISRIAQF